MPKKGDNFESKTATALYENLANKTMRYTPPNFPRESTATVTVDIIYDSGFVEGIDGAGNIIGAESTRISCLIADLPKLERKGLVTIDNVDFVVDNYDKLNPYTVRLHLNDG